MWLERAKVHRRVGYLPGEVHLGRDLAAAELMERSARLRGGTNWGYAREVARRLNLDLHRRVGTLSKGNRQKVDLLLLNEPTDGLDPLAQEAVLDRLREARAEGRTVFLSSHVLSKVERVADRVSLIRQGRLARSERLVDLKASLPQRVHVRFKLPPRADLAALPGMSEGVVDGLDFRGTWRGGPDALVRARGRVAGRAQPSERDAGGGLSRRVPPGRGGGTGGGPCGVSCFGRPLWDGRRGLGWWMVGITLYGLLVLAFYPSSKDDPAINAVMRSLPEALRSLFGEDLSTPAGYVGGRLLSLMPILLSVFAGLNGAALTAGAEARRHPELPLSQPLSRGALLAGRALALLVMLLGLGFGLFLST